MDASCSALEGAWIFGYDGRYLGTIAADSNNPFSTGNPSSTYGSPYSAPGNFNAEGKYGSPDSALSLWNPDTTKPPPIVAGGAVVALLSANPNLTSAIDPVVVASCVGRN